MDCAAACAQHGDTLCQRGALRQRQRALRPWRRRGQRVGTRAQPGQHRRRQHQAATGRRRRGDQPEATQPRGGPEQRLVTRQRDRERIEDASEHRLAEALATSASPRTASVLAKQSSQRGEGAIQRRRRQHQHQVGLVGRQRQPLEQLEVAAPGTCGRAARRGPSGELLLQRGGHAAERAHHLGRRPAPVEIVGQEAIGREAAGPAPGVGRRQPAAVHQQVAAHQQARATEVARIALVALGLGPRRARPRGRHQGTNAASTTACLTVVNAGWLEFCSITARCLRWPTVISSSSSRPPIEARPGVL